MGLLLPAYAERMTRPFIKPSFTIDQQIEHLRAQGMAVAEDDALRNRIAAPLGLPKVVMVPMLKHLSIIRNSCAHRARLWNRDFLLRMRLPQKPVQLAASLSPHDGHGPALLYNALTLMQYVLEQTAPGSDWKGGLIDLLDAHPTSDRSAMRFPIDWRTRPMWR